MRRPILSTLLSVVALTTAGFTATAEATTTATTAVTTAVTTATTVTFSAPSGPALKTPAATLDAALSCSSDLATSTKTPILLVPGTVMTGDVAYSWGYQKVLREQGHPVCIVALPGGGAQDMQITVEYVVNAVRSMSNTSGKEISLLGHSQGGLLPAWAVRFWPDLASRIDDVVSLDSPYGGTRLVDKVCGNIPCPGLAWQIMPASDWSRSLRRFPIPAGISYTSIGTSNTDLIWPSPDATTLPGATNVTLQEVCPGRFAGHLDMLSDPAAHALAMDALNHAGTASVARVDTSVCSRSAFEGADAARGKMLVGLLEDTIDALFANEDLLLANEPPIREYALGKPGDTNLALGKTTTVSSVESFTSHTGSKAVDGSRSTRWSSSAWYATAWIKVDLGSVKTINGIQIQWEDAYAEDYRLQVLEGSTWVTKHQASQASGGNSVIALDGVQGRYVRVLMDDGRCCYGNFSLWELQIIGN
jgi:hypothetical protein